MYFFFLKASGRVQLPGPLSKMVFLTLLLCCLIAIYLALELENRKRSGEAEGARPSVHSQWQSIGIPST